jgi:peptidase A4-like protein
MTRGLRLRHATITVAATIATCAAVVMSGATVASAAPVPATQTFSNGIWNGLVHEGNSTAVGAVFTVPQLQCPLEPKFIEDIDDPQAAQWIGLGGSSSPLIQAGINNQCESQRTQASYVIWQDTAAQPKAAHDVYSYPASPGDTIEVSVTYEGGITFSLSVTDLGPGHIWNFPKTIQEPAQHGTPQSAEWIVEAPNFAVTIPYVGTPLYYVGPPLANFGTVHFSLCSFAPGTSGGHLLTDADSFFKEVAGSIYGYGPPETAVSNLMSPATFTIQYLRA